MSYLPSDISQSTVKPAAGTGVSAQPLVNILTPTFRPQFYGARFDQSTDDTTAWSNMFADIAAKGYGEIVMPQGGSVIRPGVLNIPSNCSIRGGGPSISWFLRYSGQTGIMLKMNGTATGANGANHCVNGLLSDFGIVGNGAAGVLLQAIYSSGHLFSNLLFSGALNAGFQGVELWDVGFHDCLWDSCGMGVGATSGTTLGNEAVQLLGGLTATGFGASADSCNQVAFHRCRIETFKAGAIALQKLNGTNGGGSIYAIRMRDFKIETGQLAQANFISMSDDVQAATLDTSYLSINAAGTGPAVDLIYQGANFGNNIRNVVFSLGAQYSHASGITDLPTLAWTTSASTAQIARNRYCISRVAPMRPGRTSST